MVSRERKCVSRTTCDLIFFLVVVPFTQFTEVLFFFNPPSLQFDFPLSLTNTLNSARPSLKSYPRPTWLHLPPPAPPERPVILPCNLIAHVIV